MKNVLPVVPAARAPRGAIKLNGTTVTGWTSWEIETNTFYQADTFRASFAASALPANFGANDFSSQGKIEVEIFAGFPSDPNSFTAADLDSLFFGVADDVSYDLVQGTFEISGRDLTSKFIDTKTTEKYPNNTSSQIAQKLAAQQGLTPVVTATKTQVGRYYEIDKVRLHDDRTQWDLLTYLAREEQFVVYVKGKELHFEPKPDPSKDPYVFQYVPGQGGVPQGNFTGLTCSRNLTLAKDIIVYVRSWNAKNKKGFTKKAQATHTRSPVLKGSSQPTRDVQEYNYTIAGLTPDQAQQRANQLLKELTQHEMKISVSGPADNLLGITDVIQLKGTGTAWDQSYFPDSIVRSLGSEDDGYSWRIDAKNHSPESEPSA